MRLKKTMLAAALAVVSLAATGQAASAAPATWNPGGGTQITMKGNLTMVQSGTTWTCTNYTVTMYVGGSGSAGPLAYHTCTRPGASATLVTNPYGTAELINGTYWYRPVAWTTGVPGLNGIFYQQATPVQFTNGSGSTPSRLTYNNTQIGSGIVVTGTLDVKVAATGGLVTMS